MELRVSLIIIGGAIILAIYLLGRRGLDADQPRRGLELVKMMSSLLHDARKRVERKIRNTDELAQMPHNMTPMLDPAEFEHLESMVPGQDSGHISGEEIPTIVELGSEQIAPAGEQLFIPLTIMARKGRRLDGERIGAAMDDAGLVLKDDGIYRFEVSDAQGYQQVLLGLANILEPGSFDPAQLEQTSTPGLVLYLHLPAPIEAREAFDKLIEIGRQLETLLDADLCDETRSVLTRQTIGHLREKIESFRFKQKMTQVQQRRS